MNIGVWNTLKIDRLTPPGIFLVDEEGNDVLLPNKFVLSSYKEGDMLDVFVHKDSLGRIVATTLTPLIQLNSFAYLKVVQVTLHGAFLDWGLDKDLLVPFREQPKDMEEGKRYLVYLYLDHATQRLAATARTAQFLESAVGHVQKNDRVELLICETTDLGVKVIVNDKYRGLIFASDANNRLRLGDRTSGFVKQVREDGKLDITLLPEGYDKVEPLTRKFLQILMENDGFVAVTDKSDPDDIQQLTGWSKKTFKQVVGSLYKQRLIALNENGITLLETE